MRQIAALEQRFDGARIDAVYASDLQRTQITAQAILRSRRLPLTIESGLREIGMGAWEERPFGDLCYHYPEEMTRFYQCSSEWRCSGSETFQQVSERMMTSVQGIAEVHPHETVAIFSHGAAIRCLQAAIRGKHPSQTPEISNGENTAVTKLKYQDGRFYIIYENDASHLPEELATQFRQRAARKGERPLLETWFRPLDFHAERQIYCEAREDAWLDIHHSLDFFDGAGFLAEALEQWNVNPWAVEAVMWQGEVIGLLQLATERDAGQGVGYVPFVYLKPDFRCRGIGGQLVGQAVCFYRKAGRTCLRLRCAPDNQIAQRFYHRYGFVKIGAAPETKVPLDLLEKAI